MTASPGGGFRETAADRYEVDPTRPEDLDRVIAAVDGGPDPLRGTVSLWAMDFGLRPSDDADSLEGAQALLCGGALHLVQALAKRSIGSGFRLVFVTRGAQAVGPDEGRVEAAQSPLWGFGSVVALENPALDARLVDLGRETCDEEAGALLSEILSGDGEPKVALRASGRYVARLARRSPQGLTGGGPLVDTPVQVMIRERGELGNLRVSPMERRSPGPGEAEVRVGATGLNFRDVMNALGTYPGDAGPLGDECSGVVSAVGPGVENLLPGDEVMGFVPAAFGSFVTAPADLFVKRPECLSREEAAATPIAFLTAEYALAHLGRLQAGERVLIHAAAGGVGLAAVQLAQRVGAEVFATAGSPEKRAYLASLGVRHVMDSRSTVFADGVLAATGGEGVDVVLNSLAGEFIPRSLAVLKPGGRFLELGRTGVWSDREVAALGRGLRYDVVFLGSLRTENPIECGLVALGAVPGVDDPIRAPWQTELLALIDVVALLGVILRVLSLPCLDYDAVDATGFLFGEVDLVPGVDVEHLDTHRMPSEVSQRPHMRQAHQITKPTARQSRASAVMIMAPPGPARRRGDARCGAFRRCRQLFPWRGWRARLRAPSIPWIRSV